RAIGVAMLAVRCTAPGVPDVYQGMEAFRALLVDPDNRAPPDDDELDALVARAADLDGPAAWAEPTAPAARAVVLRRLLARRGERPEVFSPSAGYRPLDVADDEDEAVVAFARLDPAGEAQVLTVVARCGTDAVVELPTGAWRNILDDAAPAITERLVLGPVLDRFPAAVLAPW
ncbi:MAG: hypothetical protein ACRDZ2_02105, partial [Ilumatobacteraceae bacterium]